MRHGANITTLYVACPGRGAREPSGQRDHFCSLPQDGYAGSSMVDYIFAVDDPKQVTAHHGAHTTNTALHAPSDSGAYIKHATH